MSDTELAWAAGFFDGEGCIVCRANQVVRRHRHVPQFNRAISIVNTDKGLLDRFVAAMGVGTVKPKSIASNAFAKKPQYVIQYQSRANVEWVLGLLMPYLSATKRQRAETLLSSYPTEEQKRKNHSDGAKKQWAVRRELVKEKV